MPLRLFSKVYAERPHVKGLTASAAIVAKVTVVTFDETGCSAETRVRYDVC